jgi:hypothetical protein
VHWQQRNRKDQKIFEHGHAVIIRQVAVSGSQSRFTP